MLYFGHLMSDTFLTLTIKCCRKRAATEYVRTYQPKLFMLYFGHLISNTLLTLTIKCCYKQAATENVRTYQPKISFLLWLDKNHWIQDCFCCPKCYCPLALSRNSSVPRLDIRECFIIRTFIMAKMRKQPRTCDKHAPSWQCFSMSVKWLGMSPSKITWKARWKLFLSLLLTMLRWTSKQQGRS